MSSSRRSLCRGALILAAVSFAGCSGSQLPASHPGLPALTMPHYVPSARHRDARRSWMSPDAKRLKQLLYISDWDTNDVYVYDYKTRAQVGTLTGFDEPYGQCVDSKGDVFVANFNGASLVEYAHGGSTPIATLSTDGSTIGCSVDKRGDVAAANFVTDSGTGDIQVFAHGGGTPTVYTNGSCAYLWPPGYDDKGNLYVQGESDDFFVCELPAGGNALRTVSVNQKINFGGSVMWDGKYITLTDTEYNGEPDGTGIVQATESSSGDLTVVNETLLQDTCEGSYVDVVQPFIVGEKNTPVNRKQGTAVAGADLWCTSQAYAIWAYPGGGDPARSIASAPPAYGQAVSIAP